MSETVAFVAALVGLIVSSAGLAWTARSWRDSARAKIREPEATLEYKLELVTTLSGQLSRLNSEIQEEFTVQLAETKKLQADAETAKGIAALNEQAIKAAEALVESRMDAALAKNRKSDRRFQIRVAAIAFVAGVCAAVALQALWPIITGQA